MSIKDKLISAINKRKPDLVLEKEGDVYLRRWYVIPRNAIFNIYLHNFLHDDEDRALHDHMYSSLSWILKGGYLEHTIKAGGVHKRKEYAPGRIILRPFGGKAHRIELIGKSCWTLFITGPRYRKWGFHTKDGWVHHKEFLDPYGDGV